MEGPLNDALRNIESARSRLESCEDMYSQCGVKDSGVTQAIDDAGRAVVAAEHVQQVLMRRARGCCGCAVACLGWAWGEGYV